MNGPQQQQAIAIVRFWRWLIGLAVSLLHSLGFKVTWGQKDEDDGGGGRDVTPYDSKKSELEDFLAESAAKEQRIIDKYGAEYLFAAERGDVRFLELYLAFGMPVNYQHPKTGETALHIAAARQARHIIHAIAKIDECDFLLRDKQGRLASELAHLFGRDPEITKLLGTKERAQGDAQGITVTVRPALDAD